MTPEERELAKKRALAKARARARAAQPVIAQAQPNEPQNGNTRQGQQANQGAQGQVGAVNSPAAVSARGGVSSSDGYIISDGPGKAASVVSTNTGLSGPPHLTPQQLLQRQQLMAELEATREERKKAEKNMQRAQNIADKTSRPRAMIEGMGQGLTLGNMPKIQRGIDILTGQDKGEGYWNNYTANLQEEHPLSSFVGNIAGFGVAPGAVIAKGAGKVGSAVLPAIQQGMPRYAARLLGLSGLGGVENAVYQSTVDASNKEAKTGQPVTLPERAQMAVEGATDPLALAVGPAASGLYRTGRGLVTGKVTPKSMQPGTNAPSVDAISDMKDAAYKASDELGVTYTADGFQNLVASIENKMQSLGLDPVLHQRPARMLKVIQDRVGSPKTLQEIDNIRKIVRRDVVNSAPRDGGDAERMLGGVIIDEIDNFIQAGQNVARGDGPEAANAILKARHLHTVYKKAQVLEDAMERAKNRTATTGSGGNFYNALGQEIRKIYENPKKSAAFNQAEKAAMKKVIDGEPVQNLLRNIGKLSPQGNGLMAAIGIGSSATNPITAPFFIGGIAAKHMAEKGIKNKFDDLDAIVRSGANRPPMKNVTPPRYGAGGPMPGPAPTTPPVGPTQRLSPSSLLDDAPAPGAIARPLSDSLLDEAVTAPVDPVKSANRYFGRKSFRSENRGAAGLPKKRPDPKDLKKKKKDKKKPRD